MMSLFLTHEVRLWAWSMKKMRPVSFFDISQPGGKGPRLSSGTLIADSRRAVATVAVAVLDWALVAPISSIWRRSLTCGCDRATAEGLQRYHRRWSPQLQAVCLRTFGHSDDSRLWCEYCDQHNRHGHLHLSFLAEKKTELKNRPQQLWHTYLPILVVLVVLQLVVRHHDDEQFRNPAAKNETKLSSTCLALLAEHLSSLLHFLESFQRLLEPLVLMWVLVLLLERLGQN